jgi:hypothetical protein
MDELTKLVMQKTGLGEDQAKAAAETVISFLKSKLPGPIAAQLDGVLGGGAAGDAAKNLGGMLGFK